MSRTIAKHNYRSYLAESVDHFLHGTGESVKYMVASVNVKDLKAIKANARHIARMADDLVNRIEWMESDR